MIISIYGEEIECTKVVKGTDSIALYDDTNEIFRIDTGISAFDGYVMIEGEWTEEIEEPSQLDIIEAQITYTAMMTGTLMEV